MLGSEMIILESTLTTFEASFNFWGSWGSIKYLLELKMDTPFADLFAKSLKHTVSVNKPCYLLQVRILVKGLRYWNELRSSFSVFPKWKPAYRKRHSWLPIGTKLLRTNCDSSISGTLRKSPSFETVVQISSFLTTNLSRI